MNTKKIKVKTARFFKNFSSNFLDWENIKLNLQEFSEYVHDVVMEFNRIYDDYRKTDELKVLAFWMVVVFVPVIFFSWPVNLGIIMLLSVLRGYYLRKK